MAGLAGTVSAQSNVAIYGITDAGLVVEGGGPAGTLTKMTSGVESASRLGFRGKEDLGGGLSANFALEMGALIDNGNLQSGIGAFGRLSTVGLNGSLGAVNFGRQYTPYFKAVQAGDPFVTGLAGRATNLMSNSGTRYDNSILYTTPNLGGFSANLAYSLGEVAGNSAASRAYGFSASYEYGRIVARVAHHNANNATDTANTKNSLVGADYNFGMAKAGLAYAVNKGPGTLDSSDVMIAVTVPFGANRLVASYIRKNDKLVANKDADQVGIGYIYALSKRTDIYTAYAHINNKNGAVYKVGNNTEAGSGDRAFNLGLRHTF